MASQLGKRILNLLEQKDMTQRELAQRLGITEVSVSRYINGKHTPHTDILNRIAQILNTTTDYLLSGSEKFVYTPPSDTEPLENFIREFSIMDTDEQKKTIQSLFDILLEDKKKKK
jgi:transcriptional regulator with XRE-family HTH domain